MSRIDDLYRKCKETQTKAIVEARSLTPQEEKEQKQRYAEIKKITKDTIPDAMSGTQHFAVK